MPQGDMHRLTGERMRRINHAYNNALQKSLQSCGLYTGQPFILTLVCSHPGETQSQLARRIGVGKASLSVSLSHLEKAGMIRRQRSEQDTRLKHIYPTDLGRQRMTACNQSLHELHTRLFDGFTDEEQLLLQGYFQRMWENLETQPAQDGTADGPNR